MPSLMLFPRQAAISECVVSCLTGGDTTGCSSILDYGCICQSALYQNSVATCWDSCDPEEVAIGQAFSQQRCTAAGVTIPTSLAGDAFASATVTGSMSAVASSTAVTITGTPDSWLEPPRLYERTLTNVQAIMSSICAALFIVAVVFGVLSCRNRIKRERGQTSSQWSGAGTVGDRTKYDPTNSTTAKFPHSQSQTDTFMSSLEDYRNTVHLPPKAATGPRFTNRMSVPVAVEEEEEWELKEMDKQPGSGTSGGGEMQRQQEEEMGSRVALNQVNGLDIHRRAM